MKTFKNLAIFIMIFGMVTTNPTNAATIEGEVTKLGQTNQVLDNNTYEPIKGAKVLLPKEQYSTTTDEQGRFNLGAKVSGQTILSVEKDGYKPFSMTITEKAISKPIVVGIEKSNPGDIVIESNMLHLGDDNFSDLSANASEFNMKSIGPFYSKMFTINNVKQNSKINLVIGSIIGIDSAMARAMGQNKVTASYASPPEVYFNGNKIAEIKLNGDGQKIQIPYNLVKLNQANEVTIKTGKNLMQHSYIDYDDIEFMNLSIETSEI